MMNQRVTAILYCLLLLISSLSDNLVFALSGYRDERDSIVQRRPTIRTENDNFIIETPRNRNITLSPGPGGFVRIGDMVIDPQHQKAERTQSLQVATGPPGPQGPPGIPGPKGDRGSPDTAADMLTKLRAEGIDLLGMMEEIRALREEVDDLEMYSLKGTYPALFEFYNNKYGVRFNAESDSTVNFGNSGLMVMTEAGGVLFGQHISANDLESGTTYAITFYLTSKNERPTTIHLKIAGSDRTFLYVNDQWEINCGDGDARFAPCRLNVPVGNFKLTLVCSDSQDVLESIGFEANWLKIYNLSIDWTSMKKVWRTSPDTRRKK